MIVRRFRYMYVGTRTDNYNVYYIGRISLIIISKNDEEFLCTTHKLLRTYYTN